ncbi:MAG: hypothetical protein L6R39_004534 [Caloplaca ligustica]|nr:MAG: hypothetical protein L6R39_004534 [Caloplaca ligustica]
MLIAPVTTYVHLTNRKRLEQQPLIQAWTRVYRDEVMKDHAAEGPIACQKLVRQRLIRKSTEIYRQTGTQRWKSFLGYLQIPIWLTVIETIRRMCGQQEGLLGMIRNIVYGSQKTSDLSKQRDTVSQSAVSGPTSKINGMQASSPEANGMLEDMVEAPLIPLDPTLATEGALWFPDLLVPDPHQLLSFILSGSLLANIYYQEHYSKKRGWEPSTLQRRVGNVFKIAALAIGPLTLSLQSAIHLYLISSSVFGLANTVLLKRFLPNPTTSEQRRPEMAGVVGEEKSREGKGGAQQIRRIRKRRDPNKHKA